MKAAILSSDSASDLNLLLELARKLGLKAEILSDEQQEDIGLLYAIKQGRTEEFVDTGKFLKELQK